MGQKEFPYYLKHLEIRNQNINKSIFLKALSPQFSALTKLLIYILLKTASKEEVKSKEKVIYW